jgi:hypothetical protein
VRMVLSLTCELRDKEVKPPYPARSTLQQNLEINDEAAEQMSFIAVKTPREGRENGNRVQNETQNFR